MIAGLQKMTLLDYPGKVACTVFLHGCNFRCPFCHNSQLLGGKGQPLMEEAQLLAFLRTRQGLLDGVCITGGEPTLYGGLADLLGQIKALGFAVKLDTNGSRPQVVKALVQQELVDYIAVDAKNSPTMYPATVGVERLELAAVEDTIRFLINGTVDYELRTTVVQPLHDAASITQMGQWLGGLVADKKPKRLFLQSFTDRDTVLFAGLSAPKPETMVQYRNILAPFVEEVFIRGE